MSTGDLDLSGILSPPIAATAAVPTPETILPFGEPGLRASVAKETRDAAGPDKKPSRIGRVPLYFDIETIPDESRMERFGLPPLPTLRPKTAVGDCPHVSVVRAESLDAIGRTLRELNPCDAWLSEFELAERADKKPRKGVFDLLAELRGEEKKIAAAAEDRRLLLSTTPEFCRIVSLAAARGPGDIRVSVVGHSRCPSGEPVTELDLLESFWLAVEECSPLIGFGVINFDLPVIMVRSAILGVRPSRKLDLTPWKDEVIDLYFRRFPKGSPGGEDKSGRPSRLKSLCRVYGIDAPAGDVDGSQVERLYRESPDDLAKYNASDVHLTRELHRLWRGTFC